LKERPVGGVLGPRKKECSDVVAGDEGKRKASVRDFGGSKK